LAYKIIRVGRPDDCILVPGPPERDRESECMASMVWRPKKIGNKALPLLRMAKLLELTTMAGILSILEVFQIFEGVAVEEATSVGRIAKARRKIMEFTMLK
jgi:hypothetical protein